jgi:hypothetical protein
MRYKVVSDFMFECIKKMYSGTKFCVKYGDNEVADFVEERRVIRQGCSMSFCLFNIFIGDVIDFISKGNILAPIIEKMTIPGLLFADDLAFE